MIPAVHEIAIPNPFFEGRNRVYVIAADPVTMIDTGVATQMAFEVLEAGLNRHGLRVHDVRRVVLTHKHIDHLGNAWRLQQASDAEVWIHQSECEAVEHVDPQGREFIRAVIDRLREWHAPVRVEPDAYANILPHWQIESAEARGLVDGQQLEFERGTLEVLHTPGHTIGSICLRFGDRLFTGDHVLPNISPNVGGGDLRHQGLLGQFLASLERIGRLEPGLLALPGHGEPFATLGQRCAELRSHHEERLEQIRGILADGPLTVYELAVRLFGQMDDLHLVLGCAEAYAHLEWLVQHVDLPPPDERGRFGRV
jgi:hydroxyacylglutathione hydrolase